MLENGEIRTQASSINTKIFSKYDWASYVKDPDVKLRFSKTLELLKFEKISRMLDVACGNGFLLSLFPNSIEKFGIDNIEQGKTVFSYIKHDVGQGLPYENDFFDVVMAEEIIEHLFDTDFFLEECKRVLRGEGILILTTPNLCYYKNVRQILRGNQFWHVDYNSHHFGHIRAYSPSALRKQLEKHGFQIEELETLYSPKDKRLSDRIWQLKLFLLGIIGGVFPYRSMGKFITCKARISRIKYV